MTGDIKLLGGVRQLFPKHQFLVDLGQDISAGFQKCSELSEEIAKIEYWEGGSAIPWKIPGRATISDITLERGASESNSFYLWAVKVVDSSAGKFPTRGRGLITPDYVRSAITIQQLDRDASIIAMWQLHNAWVQKFVAGDWDNTADEVVIESITLTFDWFKRVQ